MNERSALLAAVLANPDADLPRLVMADWLEEHGDGVYAKFIRHQIWQPVSPCRNAPLTALVQLEPFVGPLVHKYATNVSGIDGATVTYPNGMEFWFRRGFVDEVHYSLAAWMEHGPAVVRSHPVTLVRLTDLEPADRTTINGQWYWFENGRNALGDWSDDSHIPRELFDLLPDAHADTIGLPFSNSVAAHDALSNAAIQWAKGGRAAT